jgi:hypothetical protein
MKLDGETDLIAVAARTLVAALLGVYVAGSVVLGVVQHAGVEAEASRAVRRVPMACSQYCVGAGQAVRMRFPAARSGATAGRNLTPFRVGVYSRSLESKMQRVTSARPASIFTF